MISKETLESIYKFRDIRDWSKFHAPKDLSIAISIESAELLEHFLWSDRSSDEIKSDPIKLEAIHEEMADIFIYLIYLAKELELDIDTIIVDKIKKNSIKYPVDKCKGSSKKYNDLISPEL